MLTRKEVEIPEEVEIKELTECLLKLMAHSGRRAVVALPALRQAWEGIVGALPDDLDMVGLTEVNNISLFIQGYSHNRYQRIQKGELIKE